MFIIYNNNYSGLIPGRAPAAGAGEGSSVDLNAKMSDLCTRMKEMQKLLADNPSANEDQLKIFMSTFEQTNSVLKTFQQTRKNKKVKEIDRFPIGSACAKNNVLAHAIILFNDTWCANEDIRKRPQRFQWIKSIVGDPKIWTVANHMYEENILKTKLVQDMENEVDKIPYHSAEINGYDCSPMEIQLKSKQITNKDVYNCIWFDSDIGNELVLYENYVSRLNKDDAKDYHKKFDFFFKEDYKLLEKIFQPLYYHGQTSALVKLNLTDSKKNEGNKFNMSRDYVLTFIHERFKNLLFWVEREKGKKDIFEKMHGSLLKDDESKQMLLNPDDLKLENKNLLAIHKDLIKFWCFFLKKWFDIIDSNIVQHENQHKRNMYVKLKIENDIGRLLTEYKEYDIKLDDSLYIIHKNLDEMFSHVLRETKDITKQFHDVASIQSDKDKTDMKTDMKTKFTQNGMDMAEVILSYVFQNGVPVPTQIDRFSTDIHTYFKDKFYPENGTRFIYFEDQPTRGQNRNQHMWYMTDKAKLNIKLTKDPKTGTISLTRDLRTGTISQELNTYLDSLFGKLYNEANPT